MIDQFDLLDIKSMNEQVKHMNIIARAEGNYLRYRALLEADENKVKAIRLYRHAITKYKESLVSTPNNKVYTIICR